MRMLGRLNQSKCYEATPVIQPPELPFIGRALLAGYQGCGPISVFVHSDQWTLSDPRSSVLRVSLVTNLECEKMSTENRQFRAASGIILLTALLAACSSPPPP